MSLAVLDFRHRRKQQRRRSTIDRSPRKRIILEKQRVLSFNCLEETLSLWFMQHHVSYFSCSMLSNISGKSAAKLMRTIPQTIIRGFHSSKIDLQKTDPPPIAPYSVRFLGSDENCIAEKLLFDVYAPKWIPPLNNPSEFRVIRENGVNRMTDKFSTVGQWVGAFDSEDNLVACSRFHTTLLQSGSELDIGLYTDLPDCLIGKEVCEWSRAAVLPSCQQKLCAPSMIKFAFRNLILKNNAMSITATSFPGLIKLYTNMGLTVGKSFKYHPSDKFAATIFYCESFEHSERVAQNFENLINNALNRK